MAGWAYYDSKGDRVPEEAAEFRCKEARVDAAIAHSARPAALAATEYHDVHSIDRPDLRKTFKSLGQMQAWFREHASLKVKRNA